MRCSDCKRYGTKKCYVPTAGEDLESADLFSCFRARPRLSIAKRFRKEASSVSLISIVCSFVVASSPWVTSAWLWLPSVIAALAFFSLTLSVVVARQFKFVRETVLGNNSGFLDIDFPWLKA